MTGLEERVRVGRSQKDRSVDQVQGIDGLARGCADALDGTRTGTGSRQDAVDASRRRDVAERQRQAMRDHVAAQSDAPWPGPTAVLAHRDDWFAGVVAAALAAAGVRVVGQAGNGADAVGISAAEQPDLLLVQDQLPMLPGPAAVQAVRKFSPGTRVVAHVSYPARIGELLDVGASAAFARSVSPADVAAALLALVTPQAR